MPFTSHFSSLFSLFYIFLICLFHSLFCKVFIGSSQLSSLCIALRHSFTTCALLTCVPLFQRMQMTSSVLLSFAVNPFTFTYVSVIYCYFTSIRMLSKNSLNSFTHNAISTYFHHVFHFPTEKKKFFFLLSSSSILNPLKDFILHSFSTLLSLPFHFLGIFCRLRINYLSRSPL